LVSQGPGPSSLLGEERRMNQCWRDMCKCHDGLQSVAIELPSLDHRLDVITLPILEVIHRIAVSLALAHKAIGLV